ITGMNWSSCSALTTLGSIESISPTWPTSCSLVGSSLSTILSFFARIMPPSRPVRPTAVHHHRVHADQLQEHHVLGEILLQLGVGHRVAAILDDQRLAVELADVG